MVDDKANGVAFVQHKTWLVSTATTGAKGHLSCACSQKSAKEREAANKAYLAKKHKS